MDKYTLHRNGNFTVLSNYCFYDPNLSNKALGLLCKAFSLHPDWQFNVNGLSSICPKDGKAAIKAQIKELESAGYLIRTPIRSQNGKFEGNHYEFFETPWWNLPEDVRPNRDLPPSEKLPAEKPLTENPPAVKPPAGNQSQLNTKEVNTNQLNTYLINNPSINLFGTDRQTVEEYIMEQIEFDVLSSYLDGERLQEVVTVIADSLCTTKTAVRINNENVPFKDVADRFLKLDSEHIQFVLDCIDNAHDEIKNMRAYILTLLFNASATMKNCISAQFERDMRNEGS